VHICSPSQYISHSSIRWPPPAANIGAWVIIIRALALNLEFETTCLLSLSQLPPFVVMGSNADEKSPAASPLKHASLSYMPERLRFVSLVFGLALIASLTVHDSSII